MDPVQFFNTILPSSGLRVMAVPAVTKGGHHYFQHFYGHDDAWLAEATQHLDANRKLNIYYGCATYDANGTKSESGNLERKQTNVVAVRSFWLDLDVGESKPGKPPKYPTQKAAAQSILEFVAKLGLPTPYLVRSGGGVHVYWPMSQDMSPAIWQPTAQLLKAACLKEGVLADPTRTADHASVLRPPGTHHRKAEPKPVVVAVVGEVSDLADFQSRLLPYAGGVELPSAVDDPLGPLPDHLKDLSTSNDLSAGIERRPCSAEKAAEHCGILKMVRDSGGNVDQPTWYHALGVLAVSDDGVGLVGPWSQGHPQYNADEADRKFQQYAKIGKPPTCAKLGEHHTAICAACPHAGVIKTPFVLGQYEPGARFETTREVKTEQGWNTIKVTIDQPDGFIVLDNKLCHSVLDDDGEWQTEPFCDTVILPVSRLWIEGVAYVEWEMSLRGGATRRFVVEGGTIGKGKDTLAAELGRQEVVALNGKGHVMDAYMKRWMTHLKDTADQITAYRHFGWTDERSFALGTTILHPGGGDTRAVLTGMAKSKASALEPKGSLDKWVSLVDRAYNAPGQEAYQFLVACGFAAPLLSMMKQVNGVTVYAHSEGSGAGKTTAQRVALSAWGNWDALMLADGKTTQNAMWALMGAYHTLPVVYDELTNQKNDVTSDLVFSISSGRSKERMRADGELRENNSNWCTILMASGNNLLSEKLALHRGNAEAEISRLFEYTVRAAPHLTPNEANAIFPQFTEHYGHAGREWARHLVDHYESVQAELFEVQRKLNVSLRITQVERHWSALLAAVMVAVARCRMIGLLQFDIPNLHKWLVERLSENRIVRISAANDPLELFGGMLADLWQGILVTNGEGDMRKGVAASIVEKPRGVLVGRAILPQGGNTTPVLMLNTNAVRDWANKKGISAKEMFDAAVAAGWADAQLVRYSLGKGTIEYSHTSSYINCWKINPEKIAGADAGKMIAQKFNTIDGGKNASGSNP